MRVQWALQQNGQKVGFIGLKSGLWIESQGPK
jgi:hypothetical protein